MYIRKFEDRYFSNPKHYAQNELAQLTHYVDDDTLRFHKSKILDCGQFKGLIFWLVESVALDMENSKRGFRYVAFDVSGRVISRVDLEDCAKNSKTAKTQLTEFLNSVDAMAITLEAIEQTKASCDYFLNQLTKESVK